MRANGSIAGRGDAPVQAPRRGELGPHPRAVVLVEGRSDQAALAALAARSGHDLDAEGIRILPMGGATNIGDFLTRYGPSGHEVRLAGLYDEAEEPAFRRACERHGLGPVRTRTDLERLGFFGCVVDLEDELIRALGAARVEQVIADNGELRSLRSFQRQPDQRRRTVEQQLRRFLGTRSGRKIEYARCLVEALDPGDVPRPLAAALAHVLGAAP